MGAQEIDESGVGDIRSWDVADKPSPELGDAFERMVEQLRRFQNSMTASRPTAEVVDEMASALQAMSDRLDRYAVDEASQIAGKQTVYQGRSQAMSPVLRYEQQDPDVVGGSVEFGRFYLGGNGAVHGGAIPLFFDEVLGRLAGGGRPRCRTAFLHVNFRNITPIERTLRFAARVDRIEGRKLYLIGELFDGEVLVADAEGLFVTLKPGQP